MLQGLSKLYGIFILNHIHAWIHLLEVESYNMQGWGDRVTIWGRQKLLWKKTAVEILVPVLKEK